MCHSFIETLYLCNELAMFLVVLSRYGIVFLLSVCFLGFTLYPCLYSLGTIQGPKKEIKRTIQQQFIIVQLILHRVFNSNLHYEFMTCTYFFSHPVVLLSYSIHFGVVWTRCDTAPLHMGMQVTLSCPEQSWLGKRL